MSIFKYKFNYSWQERKTLDAVKAFAEYTMKEPITDTNYWGDWREKLCYYGAIANMYYFNSLGKDVDVCFGNVLPREKIITHAWVEVDGKEYHLNQPHLYGKPVACTKLQTVHVPAKLSRPEIIDLFNGQTLIESFAPKYDFDTDTLQFWVNPKDKTQNALIVYNDRLTRLRAGIMIIKDDQILLSEEADEPGVFSLPGGGLEPGETPEEAAKREAQEEVFINVKNVRYANHDYCEEHDELKNWVAENVPEKYQWYNYYTCLCIGEYDGEYKGKVDKVDLDPAIKNAAKFYSINEVINKDSFKQEWKETLVDLGYVDKSCLTEDLKDDAKEYFGTTWNWRLAFYLNTDGTLLDGSGKKLGASGYDRAVDHREISDIFNKSISGNDAMLEYIAEGNIRLKPEAPGFEMYLEPNQRQYEVLSRLISNYDGEYYVDIINRRGNIVKSFTYEDSFYDRYKTIQDIKNYFAEHPANINESAGRKLIAYHWSKKHFLSFQPNWQGIHLAQTKKLCKALADFRQDNFYSGYLYEVELDKSQLHPAYFAIDPMDWSAKSIAHLLLGKINNTPVYGATAGVDEYGDTWKDNNSPDVVKVNNLTKDDIPVLTKIEKVRDGVNNFKDIIDFLQAKGYNCIIYEDYGESDDGELVYMMFDTKYLTIKSIINLAQNHVLVEDTRTQQISASRNAGMYKNNIKGKNRFERKKYSKIATTVKQYNTIDMNKFFKDDTLEIDVPVTGETNSYKVSLKLIGVCSEIARNIKANSNKFEYRTVVQALTKTFNTTDVYTKCTCDDFKYRLAHWNIVHNVSVDDTTHDPGPGKGIANPNDDKGRGCKHILLVLANGDWMMKVASCITNYIHWMEENKSALFLKVIFPKLYGVTATEAVEAGLVSEDTDLESEKHVIETINDWAKNRGKYKAGTNKNPVTGTGGRSKTALKQTSSKDEVAEDEAK